MLVPYFFLQLKNQVNQLNMQTKLWYQFFFTLKATIKALHYKLFFVKALSKWLRKLRIKMKRLSRLNDYNETIMTESRALATILDTRGRNWECYTICSQFHQRFLRAFFVQIIGAKPNVTRENDVCTKNLYVKRWWNWHLH